MFIFNSYAEFNQQQLKQKCKGTAVAIGNFDGCHLGHQKVLTSLIEAATENQWFSLALSFNPHPAQYFGKNDVDKLFSVDQKNQAFEELGLNGHLCQSFDDDIADLPARHFFSEILLKGLHSKFIIVGEDFRFGKQRSGDIKLLNELCKENQINCAFIPPQLYANEMISSSRIRNLINVKGDVKEAAALLGRPYLLKGCIGKGAQLGRTLSFPTANLQDCEQLLPRDGVYAAIVWLEPPFSSTLKPLIFPSLNSLAPAVINVGHRPTVDKGEKSIEAHLIDRILGLDDLYNKEAGFYFIDRLRDEITFPNLDALKQQISEDIKLARKKLVLQR